MIAGLTVWAVLVPESLAYASIAGVSPVVGLYAAPGALIMYAALGSSRHLIAGPMSATAALSAATVADVVTADGTSFAALTTALALTTAVMALLAGALRLGFLASFISEPVIKGFIVGLSLVIIVGQLPPLFGVEKGSGDFFEKLWHFLSELGETHVLTLVVGVVSLAIVVGCRRFAPVVPGALLAVVVGIAAVRIFDLAAHGVAIVGDIDRGLPAFGLPDASLHDYGTLAAGAIGVLLVGFAEGLGAAKVYAERDHYELSANRELIAIGGANIASGLSAGMVVNGSLSKTAVNGEAGARTQLSGLLVALLTILTLLVLTGLFADLPEATLAAIVIAAVVELVDFPGLVRLHHVFGGRKDRPLALGARPDFVAAVAALVGVLVFDTLPGLFIGIGASLILLIYRASRPDVKVLGSVPGAAGHYGDITRDPENRTIEGIAILRVDGGLFFANAEAVRARMLAAAKWDGVDTLILDAETVPFIDVTAAHMLARVDQDLERQGVRLLMARNIGAVRDVLRRAGEERMADRIYRSVQDAVDAARDGA